MVHLRVGLTLLEIMAVIVISSILVCGAFVVFKQPLRKAQELEFREKIIASQNQLRDKARRIGTSGVLIIVSDELTVEIDGRTTKIPLGSCCRVEQIITPNGRKFSEAAIGVDVQGISQTFAIQIVPDKSDRYWLLFVGGSGEVIEFEKEWDVQEIINNL